MGVRFPSAVVREEVKKGKDPASQTVISFFGDAGKDEYEMHRVRAAANVLSIRLREILREELSGTYGVSVGYDSSLPLPGLRGRGHPVRQRPRERRDADQGGVHGGRATARRRARLPTT